MKSPVRLTEWKHRCTLLIFFFTQRTRHQIFINETSTSFSIRFPFNPSRWHDLSRGPRRQASYPRQQWGTRGHWMEGKKTNKHLRLIYGPNWNCQYWEKILSTPWNVQLFFFTLSFSLVSESGECLRGGGGPDGACSTRECFKWDSTVFICMDFFLRSWELFGAFFFVCFVFQEHTLLL